MMLDEGMFFDELAGYFRIERTAIQGNARLDEDLGFDSIMYFEVALLLEELGGISVQYDIPVSIVTAGDLYSQYVSAHDRVR